MHNQQPQWFAVFCKPRQERVARDSLQRQGFDCFLPEALNPYQRRSRNSRPRVEPLFPRYLFLNAIPESQSLAVVRSSRGVVGLVRSGVDPVRVPEDIIGLIRARQDSATGLVALEPSVMKQGDRVRVFDGPLDGVEGILKSHGGTQRALVLMELLGRHSLVEVDCMLLQRAG